MRMAEVDDFIEDFVDKDEVFSDHFLADLAKEVFDYDNNAV